MIQHQHKCFSLGANNRKMHNGNNFIAYYAFAEKKGYSKFGTYTGNGNADGTFVYLGFKPAFVIMIKPKATANWRIWDNKREVIINDESNNILCKMNNGAEYDNEFSSDRFFI